MNFLGVKILLRISKHKNPGVVILTSDFYTIVNKFLSKVIDLTFPGSPFMK